MSEAGKDPFGKDLSLSESDKLKAARKIEEMKRLQELLDQKDAYRRAKDDEKLIKIDKPLPPEWPAKHDFTKEPYLDPRFKPGKEPYVDPKPEDKFYHPSLERKAGPPKYQK